MSNDISRRDALAFMAASLGAGALSACLPVGVRNRGGAIYTLPGGSGDLLDGALPDYMKYGTLSEPHKKAKKLMESRAPTGYCGPYGTTPIYEAQTKMITGGKAIVLYAMLTKNRRGGDVFMAFRTSGDFIPAGGHVVATGVYDGKTNDFDGEADGWLRAWVTDWNDLGGAVRRYSNIHSGTPAVIKNRVHEVYQNLVGNLLRANDLGLLR